MNNLTVSELKKKAQQLGVKVKGQGWKGCCPPEGKKADIITAIKNKGSKQKKKKRRIPLTTNTNTNTNTTMGDWSRDQCLLKCGRFMGTQSEKPEISSPGLTKGQQRYKEALDRLEEKYGSNQENDDNFNPEWEIAELKAQLLDPDITEEDRDAIEDQIEYIQEEIDEAAEYIAEEDDVLLGSGKAASRSSGKAASRSRWSRSETKRMNRLRGRLDRLHRHY
jgi:hypothetical protein